MTRKSKLDQSFLPQKYHCTFCGLVYKTLSRYDLVCRNCAAESETQSYRESFIFTAIA